MYFITCFEKIDYDNLWLDIGDYRTFGYYDTFEKCETALNENRLDMWETIYNFAIVEEIGQGIHSPAFSRWFFVFDKNKKGFFRMEEPEVFRHSINIALG